MTMSHTVQFAGEVAPSTTAQGSAAPRAGGCEGAEHCRNAGAVLVLVQAPHWRVAEARRLCPSCEAQVKEDGCHRGRPPTRTWTPRAVDADAAVDQAVVLVRLDLQEHRGWRLAVLVAGASGLPLGEVNRALEVLQQGGEAEFRTGCGWRMVRKGVRRG